MALGWSQVISVQFQPSNSQGRLAVGSMVLLYEVEAVPELRGAAGVQPV